MVNFSQYYSFPAERVDHVRVLDMKEGDFPYVLRVVTKSGRELDVSYKVREVRDNAKAGLCAQIGRELSGGEADLLYKLSLILNTVERLDKRQLKIWQQLKKIGAAPDGGEDAP